MSTLYTSMEQLIGKTPLLELTNIQKKLNLQARILAKLEFLNPAGSTQDRIAKALIDDAERSGRLKPGGTIVEPSSGNAGIGLCAVGVPRGYRVIIVMPEDMSLERRKLVKIYGGELVLTSKEGSIPEAIAKAEEIVNSTPGAIMTGQFSNPANPKIHYETTGKEIWEDAGCNIDFFTAGVGTGGSLTGVGQFLRRKNPNIKIVALEPKNAATLAGESFHPHAIQGIGDGLIPEVLDTTIYDELIKISDEEALEYTRMLARAEGLLVGTSSGAYLCSAVKLARRPENKGKTIATIFADSGMRYFSTELFD